MKRTLLIPTLFVLAAFGLVLGLAGCAGGAVDFNVWAANYTGTGTLDNSKVGDLDVTSDANGLVTGTLTVTGVDGAGTEYKFSAGIHNLSGSITSTGGNFEVSGTVVGEGPFLIRGRFPTDTVTPKTYTVITSTSVAHPDVDEYPGTLMRN